MKIAFTPDWFLGTDVLIEIFSFAVLLIFFILCVRSYKLTKNKSTVYLGAGFLAIALAEIFTILTKLILFYDTTFTQEIGHMIITYHVVKSVDIFYYLGFFLHKIFTLLGFYIIYKIPSKKGTTEDYIIGACFIIIAAAFSQVFYYVFHITILVLLGLIIYNYSKIYKKNKLETTKILLVAFWILAVSHLLLCLSTLQIVYVFGQVLQLVSYLTLLILIIGIRKYGKEKSKKRHNL
ncbi:Membrane-associated sensor domain protein [uncultured archaeon]|nr:Membrane-associated sensor domain protein [uncultured archaeon]